MLTTQEIEDFSFDRFVGDVWINSIDGKVYFTSYRDPNTKWDRVMFELMLSPNEVILGEGIEIDGFIQDRVMFVKRMVKR